MTSLLNLQLAAGVNLQHSDHDIDTSHLEGSDQKKEVAAALSTQLNPAVFGSCLQRMTLYETVKRLFVTACDRTQSVFRILTIDRTCPGELKVSEDPQSFTSFQCQVKMDELLKQHPLEKKSKIFGILGT